MAEPADPLPIDLALQGGGSHGAFTWGVLDRLLEEERLRIVAISGTSAGAMNAAVLADGWTDGGAAGARAALRTHWQEVSRAAALSPLQRSPLDRMMGRWTLDTSPAYIAMDLMSRLLSPYDLNPLAYNPLRFSGPPGLFRSFYVAHHILNQAVGFIVSTKLRIRDCEVGEIKRGKCICSSLA